MTTTEKRPQLYFGYQDCGVKDLNYPDRPWVRFKYSDVEGLRDLVREFIVELVETNKTTVLKNQCGRCGNSCRRETILVREQELLLLQQHLSLSEEQFRQRYLNPSPTWNPGDGLMRLENGACPFLQVNPRDPQGHPNTTTCSIHELRPQDCRDYVSDKAHCAKDTGHLIERLTGVWMEHDTLRFAMVGGELADVPTPTAWWERLGQAMREAEPSNPQKYERISKEVLETLERTVKNFDPGSINDTVRDNCRRLKRLVDSLTELQHFSSEEGNERLETMWSLVRKLERLVHDDPSERLAAPAAVPAGGGGSLDWMMLQEQSLVARLPQQPQWIPVDFPSSPALREAVTYLLCKILERPEELLQDTLREKDPPCYMCGECCRFYGVEIKPSDIHRLCDLLPMTPAQFVEEHTIAGRFSWNPFSRILKKVEVPIYSKNLKSLRLLGEEGNSPWARQCVFLERRDDGFFYCQVHSHKPQVCRNYPATNALCKNTNQRENWGRQAKSVAFIEVTPHTVQIQARSRLAENKPPLLYQRCDWPEVDSALCSLESLVRQEITARAATP